MQQNNTTKIKFDNKSTQNSLEKAKIPFIFYSKELRQFLTADNKIIDNISQLRLKEAKIIDKPICVITHLYILEVPLPVICGMENEEAKNLFIYSRYEFELKAKDWTKCYA